MGKNGFVFIFIFMILFGGFSSAFAAAPATIIGKFVSTALSPLIKWLWSLKTTSKTAISGRSMMKFESGYTVETVFDGSKLGIEPYSVEVSPSGELLLLDSANSNLYKITQPLSRYSRPRLIAGSAEGYSGHVDGKPRESRMSNPKGLTVDDRGNVYIADTMNMVIRKISDTGVTTIAGGSWGGRGGGHIDGPSEDAKFSNDFDVLYVGSSCSLLIIDRGSQAIREMQLQFDDCAYQYETGFPLGIAVLVAAAFFGYMLALLQRRVGSILSSQKDPRTPRKTNFPPSPYEKPLKASVRPPLIPTEDELEKQEEGLFGSMWKLFLNTGTVFAEIAGGVFSFRRKSVNFQNQHIFQQKLKHSSDWPLQESFVIPDEDEPPPTIESRTPTPRKTYAFMTKDAETHHPLRQSRAYYNGWSGDFQQQQLQQQHQLQQQQLLLQQQQQQQQQQQHQQQQQQQKYYRHQQQNYPSGPKTYYEQSCETTNEIVFGAVQEQDGRREAVVIKAVDYGDPIYNHHNIRSRINYMGYSHGY